MLKPIKEWSGLLSNIWFFNSTIQSQPSLAFWIQNLRQFGTINILYILGLDPSKSDLHFVNVVGEPLVDPSGVAEVLCALDQYQTTEEAALRNLIADGGHTSSQRQMVSEIRILLYDRWRRIFRSNERWLYMEAMNLFFDGTPIWEVTMDTANPNKTEETDITCQVVPETAESAQP